MSDFLHDRKDFRELLAAVAENEKINDPALVEKDYWIMHSLYGLDCLGLKFELKGGTSLSKGFGVIHRFSEDIDIRIEPFDGIKVSIGSNDDKPAHIKSRQNFFEKLQEKIKIPGIQQVERDTNYDDKKLRNAGLRLLYSSHYGSVPGLKDGILLEAGFDQTSPHQSVTISSWATEFARSRGLKFSDNRALNIRCYNPEYTFVEKLQTVARKFRQFKESGKLSRNFLRHYYDIHQLLELPAVQNFIGTPDYIAHKKKRFRNENLDLTATDVFQLTDLETRKQLEAEYTKTAALYYKTQVPLADILARIAKDLKQL